MGRAVSLALLPKFAFPNGNNMYIFTSCRGNFSPKGWVILHWASASFTHPSRDRFAPLSTAYVQKIGPGLRDIASTRTRDHTTFFVTLPVHGKGKPKNIFLSAPTSFYGCFFRSSRQNGKLDTRSPVTLTSAATDKFNVEDILR